MKIRDNMLTQAILNHLKNKSGIAGLWHTFLYKKTMSKSPPSIFFEEDISYHSSYNPEEKISLLERLMYFPFEDVEHILKEIPENIFQKYTSSHDSKTHRYYMKLVCAAVDAQNYKAISFFNKINSIPSSMFAFSKLKDEKSIGFKTCHHYLPALVAVQNLDKDMLAFLMSFEGYGWGGNNYASMFSSSPCFTLWHEAIREANIEQCAFLIENGFYHNKDHEGSYPFDYLLRLSDVSLTEVKIRANRLFPTLNPLFKQRAISISSEASEDAKLVLYEKLFDIGLSWTSLQDDLFVNTSYGGMDFEHRKKIDEAYSLLKKRFTTFSDFAVFYKNAKFFQRIQKHISEDRTLWHSFVFDQCSDPITGIRESFKDIQQRFQYELLSLTNQYKNIDFYDIDASFLPALKIDSLMISNPSFDTNRDSRSLRLLGGEPPQVKLNHLNLSIILKDDDYIRKAIDFYNTGLPLNFDLDLFMSSNVLLHDPLTNRLGNIVLKNNQLALNSFLFKSDTGVVPLVYWQENKDIAIDNKALFKNYVAFIKKLLCNSSFHSADKSNHDLSIFLEKGIPAEEMLKEVNSKIGAFLGQSVLDSIFSPSISLVREFALQEKMNTCSISRNNNKKTRERL